MAQVQTLEQLTEELKLVTAPSNEDLTKAITVLTSLRSVPVTEDDLRKTGLNVVLNGLRKHSNPNLVKEVKETVSAFKAALGLGDKRKTTESTSATEASDANLASGESKSVQEPSTTEKRVRVDASIRIDTDAPPASSPSASSGASSAPAETPQTGGVTPGGHTFRTGWDDESESNPQEFKLGIVNDAARSKMQTLIHDALGDEFPPSLRVETAVRIESSIFQVHGAPNGGSTAADYRNQVRALVANLRDPDNPDINRRLLSGEVSPSEIAKMREADMASDALKRQRQQTERDALDSRRSDWDKENGAGATDEFKCHKCKKRKCTYYQRQTRSADEPMTTFITCLECGYRWREY